MRLHSEDEISFAGYRQLDIRHDSAWIVSCVLYAHSAICLFTIMAFASYGLVWPVRETDTMLHKTTRKGTRDRKLQLYGNVQMFKFAFLHRRHFARPSRPNRFWSCLQPVEAARFQSSPPSMEWNVSVMEVLLERKYRELWDERFATL